MMNLSEKKVAELREIAKGMNIPKYYSLKKETLIQSIQEIQMKLEESKRLEETMNRNTLNGATRDDVTEYYIRKLGKNLDYAKALTRALYDDESANDMKLVFETYQEKLSWKKAPKRSQWDCIQVNVSTVKDLTFNSNEAVSIRSFGSKKEAYDAQAIVTVPVSITRAKKVADSMNRDLLIFKAVPFNPYDAVDETALQLLLNRIYHNGITDVATGRHYLPAVQSASQARQGSLWFFEANSFDEVDEFRLKCLRLTKEKYQELFGDHVLMSKLEARVGLAVSNTLDMNDVCLECRSEDFINVINSLNVKVIDDVYVDTKFNAILPVMGSQGLFNGQTMLKEDFHANMNASEGCGLMSVSTAIKINYGLHLITHEEFVRATNEWEKIYDKNLDNVTDKECWFRKFILRLSKVVQFRHAGDKGIIVMANMEAEGIKEDILLHDSVRKYDCGEWNDAPFEICMYDKPKTGMANLNFQFIQALNIKPDSLIELADRHLNNITNNILQDAKVAMKFLGMVNRIGQDDDSENLSSTRKLETVLRTDPLMIKDAQVQKWLMEKVKKFISDLAIGRIPVEGAYYYIVTDPRYLMSAYTGKPLKHLQAGQYYLNGREGKCAGFRSPLIYWGEAQLLDCIEDEGLWYYTDLVIFNPYDGKAPAMGGADFDGDKILATFEEIIVNAVRPCNFILYDQGVSGKKVPNTWEERITHFLKTSVHDQTGYITNLATKWTDLLLNWELVGNMENAKAYDNCVKALRFLQGWEIDSAKTGKNANDMGFPKALKIKETPDWFVGMRTNQGRQVSMDKMYVSNAPLGKLFKHVSEFQEQLKLNKNAENKCFYLSQNLSQKEYDCAMSIKDKVAEMEKAYCKEISNSANYYSNGIYNKEQFSSKCKEISTRYNMALLSMVDVDNGFTEDAIAFCAYYVTNDKLNHVSSSTSFPWSCFFDSMIQLMYRNNNVVDLYRLPETKEIDSIYVLNNNLYINDDNKGFIDCPDMELRPIIIEDRPFVLIPKIAQHKTVREQKKTEIAPSYKSMVIEVNGFKYNKSVNCENFLQMVKDNGNMFDIVPDSEGNVRIMIKGQIVANLSSKAVERKLAGKTVRFVSSSSTTYIPKPDRVSKAQMKNSVEAYSGQLTIEIMVAGDSTQETPVITSSYSDTNYGYNVPMSNEDYMQYERYMQETSYDYSQEDSMAYSEMYDNSFNY